MVFPVPVAGEPVFLFEVPVVVPVSTETIIPMPAITIWSGVVPSLKDSVIPFCLSHARERSVQLPHSSLLIRIFSAISLLEFTYKALCGFALPCLASRGVRTVLIISCGAVCPSGITATTREVTVTGILPGAP